VHLDN